MLTRATVPLGPALAVIGIAVVALGAYGEKVVTRTARKDRTTVVYWEKWTGDEGDAMKKIVEMFNASQDRIFVKYLSISGIDQKTILATAGGNPPDVAGLWQNQVCMFADMGALSDLSELAAKNGIEKEDYIDAYWAPLFYRNKLWALPSTPASIALHVNRDLVPPEYASEETFPKTIEELDALSDRIRKEKAGPNGEMKTVGFLPSSPGWFNWAWGGLFGGTLMDGDKITVNSPEAIRAFKWIQSYAKRYGFTEVQSFQSGFGNFASPMDPFMSGKTATELNGTWKANFIRIYNPKIDWFVVSFPYPKDRPDLEGHSMTSQDVLVIPRGAKHKEEAFEFVRFVQKQENMELLCKLHGKNSPLAQVSEGFNQSHVNKAIRFFDTLARSKKTLLQPQVGILTRIEAEINVAFQEVNSGVKEPKQALDDAQKRIDRQWRIYKEQVLDAPQAGEMQ